MSDRQQAGESLYQGGDDTFMEINGMVNEGLGGGLVTGQNGLIEDGAATRSIKGGSRYAGQPSE